MNQTPTTPDFRVEPIDSLLSDFFKAQLTQPWPAAPATTASEPSVLVASRNAAPESPRNQPAAVAARDASTKSRYTLAASVALLLGVCWYCADGYQPAERPAAGTPTGGMLDGAGASNPDALKNLREKNAVNGIEGTKRPKIELP
jgi:hypothetical protein